MPPRLSLAMVTGCCVALSWPRLFDIGAGSGWCVLRHGALRQAEDEDVLLMPAITCSHREPAPQAPIVGRTIDLQRPFPRSTIHSQTLSSCRKSASFAPPALRFFSH